MQQLRRYIYTVHTLIQTLEYIHMYFITLNGVKQYHSDSCLLVLGIILISF